MPSMHDILAKNRASSLALSYESQVTSSSYKCFVISSYEAVPITANYIPIKITEVSTCTEIETIRIRVRDMLKPQFTLI